MAINPDRPIITYENVALFQSQTPAHSAVSNSGSNLSFLPLVQGIDFSVDIPRTNVGALGTKDFIDQSNRNAPDVNLTINTFEDFGNLFSGLVSGANTRDDLNIDRNFYAIVGDERGVDVSGEYFHDRDILSFGNCFLNNVSISQSVGGLMSSSYSYVGSNLQAEVADLIQFKVSGIAAYDGGFGFDGPEDQSGVFIPSGTRDGQTQWASAFNNHKIYYLSLADAWVYTDSDDGNPLYVAFLGGSDPTYPWDLDLNWILPDEYDAEPGTYPEFYDIGDNQIKSPSINLTGDQSQNINASFFARISDYYSNSSDDLIPVYSTNVTISGNSSVGNFLIKSDSIQSFDLNLPINRKTIYSLGKKYPVKRKALFPTEGTFGFSNRVSNFEVNGDRANLKDFLNSDESYTINISGKDNAENNFNLQIGDAKLISQSYNSAIGSDIVADLGFSFELNKFSKVQS